MTKVSFRIFILLFTHSLYTFCQTNSYAEKPKLLIAIVVDQMRYDYIPRFFNKYKDRGFKRLLDKGFEFRNHHFNYIPTYTGPGHASIFTGSTPQYHGIIANNWYDKFEKKSVYCVSDSLVNPIGTVSEQEKRSPRRLLTTTFADSNRIDTQFKGKTIGISIKDRGAILPAGHSANRAYWFRGKDEGQWVSSDYYGSSFPKWVTNYNKTQPANTYLKTWNTLLPINTYSESGPDNNNYEKGFSQKALPTFPYNLKKLKEFNGNYDILKQSPFGNSLVTDFAIKAIKEENLGKDIYTDILTISYSSTDYIGHNFGVNSKEIEDTYLRLDLEIEKLLNVLDKEVGENEYTLFLTADHGAVHVPQFLKDHKIPGHYFNYKVFIEKINTYLHTTFNTNNLIINSSNNQLFLNYNKLEKLNLPCSVVTNKLQEFISKQPYIQHVFTRSQLIQKSFNNKIGPLVQNGFHQRLSGDIAYVLTPATITYTNKGSTHGSPQVYDTHVPLLFFGKGIAVGKSYTETSVVDIAPTICALLAIAQPNASSGIVLSEALKK